MILQNRLSAFKPLGIGLVLIFSYVFFGLVGINLVTLPNTHLTLIWFASGIGLIAFRIFGNRAFFLVLLASLGVNFPFYLAVSRFPFPVTLVLGVLVSVGDALQSFFACKISLQIEKRLGRPLFEKGKDFILYFFLVCTLPAAITCWFFVLVTNFLGGIAFDNTGFLRETGYLTLSDALGLLLIGPLYWGLKYRKVLRYKNIFTRIFLNSLSFLILLLSLFWQPLLVFLVFPLLLLCSTYPSLIDAAFSSLSLALLMAVGTANGLGLFVNPNPVESFFNLVLFLLVVVFMRYYLVLIFIDENNTKELLQRTEVRYRHIVDSAAVGVFQSKPDGKVLFLNSTILSLLEYESIDDINSHGGALIVYKDPKDRKELIRIIGTKGRIDNYEIDFVTKNKKPVAVSLNMRLQNDILYGTLTDITERKQAEKTLQEASLYTRSLIEASLDPFVTIGPDGKITDVNKGAELVSGVSRNRLIGSDYFIYLTEPEKAIDGFKEVFLNGFIRDYPLAIRHISGKVTDVLFNATLYKNEAGEIQGVFAAARDITELKQMEDALRKSRETYRCIVETTGEGIWIIDSENRTTFVNTALTQMLGYAPEEMIGMPLDKFIFEEDLADHNSQMAIRHSGKSSKYERRLNRKDGSICYCLISGTAMYDEKGRVTGAFAMLTDITERKRIENILEKEQQELKLIIDSSPIIVFYKDKEGKFLRVNKTFAEALKLPEEEFIGKTVFDLYSAQIAQGMTNDDQEVLKSGRPKLNIIEQYESVHGSRWVQTDKIPICDKNGIPVGLIGFAQDITERKRAEEELNIYRDRLEGLVEERTQVLEKTQEALTNIVEELNQKSEELEKANVKLKELDQLKSMFIAGMSHELRTPLNSIIGFTGIILQGLVGPISEEQRKQLAMVKNSANYLLSLINDIIDISKIEAGKAELYIEEFDLSYLVKDVVKSFEIAAENKGLQLALNIPDKLIIKSDERRLKQVVMNLVSNAVKFTEEGSVRVSVRLNSEFGIRNSELKKESEDSAFRIPQSAIEISIEDTGIGIHQEDIEKLFVAFSRIYIKDRPVIEGTGLGLYVSKKIVDMLGGEIKAESEFGKGSRFTVRIPMKTTVNSE